MAAPRVLGEQFRGRANSLGFLRWVFAAMVVVDHSFPIAQLGTGRDPTWQFSRDQDSLGGIAVAGFFVISGFLVTRSWFGSGSAIRFVWRRFLRIFPGYWVCLIVTAVVLAPIAWRHEFGGLTGVFSARTDPPLHYVTANFWLTIHQWNIGGLFLHSPYARSGLTPAWDGSLWTLSYEFTCYLALAVVGFVGLLRYRRAMVVVCAACYVLTLSWLIDPAWAGKLAPVLADLYIARFGFLFSLGALFALYADRIVVDDRLGVLALVTAVWTLHFGGWLAVGYPAFAYAIIWLAVRLPIRHWERFGDFSYGTYIWAFPLQMLLAEYGLQRHGAAVFIMASLAVATAAAVLSWHLVEKHALRLKNATPRWPRLRRRRNLPVWNRHPERRQSSTPSGAVAVGRTLS